MRRARCGTAPTLVRREAGRRPGDEGSSEVSWSGPPGGDRGIPLPGTDFSRGTDGVRSIAPPATTRAQRGVAQVACGVRSEVRGFSVPTFKSLERAAAGCSRIDVRFVQCPQDDISRVRHCSGASGELLELEPSQATSLWR